MRWNWLFNVTINDISVIYVTAHKCAGGLKKKLDLRSGSQRHRHFVGFFNVPVLAPTRDQPFYTVISTHRAHLVAFYDHAGDTEVHILDLTPRALTGALEWASEIGCLTSHATIFQNLHCNTRDVTYMTEISCIWHKTPINSNSIYICDGTKIRRQIEVEVEPTVELPTRDKHFVGFYNVPVQAPTRGHPLYGSSEKPPI